jgi:hypothetical protein
MNKRTKELMALAYRERAGLIGLLGSCICLYPLEKEPTSSGHSEFCPAHRMQIGDVASSQLSTVSQASVAIAVQALQDFRRSAVVFHARLEGVAIRDPHRLPLEVWIDLEELAAAANAYVATLTEDEKRRLA